MRALFPHLPPCPIEVMPVEQALGLISSGHEVAQRALPATALAARAGYAVAALDLMGASGFSPVLLPSMPPLLPIGAALPPGTDAIADPSLIEDQGAYALAKGEVIPGESVVPVSAYLASGAVLIPEGQPVTPAHLTLCEIAGQESVSLRRPKVAICHAEGPFAPQVEALLTRMILAEGATLAPADTADIRLWIGGGATFPPVFSYAPAEPLYAQVSAASVDLALPPLPDRALAIWLLALRPMLDALSNRQRTAPLTRPVLRKISSSLGVTEVVLLDHAADGWLPLAIGTCSPADLARAAAYAIIPAGDEGLAAGDLLAGLPI